MEKIWTVVEQLDQELRDTIEAERVRKQRMRSAIGDGHAVDEDDHVERVARMLGRPSTSE